MIRRRASRVKPRSTATYNYGERRGVSPPVRPHAPLRFLVVTRAFDSTRR
ncbi:hypothetical protein FTUN_6963 [Frigoriglobus tundricola]|uniref:Uncharacterized protein n=1 Tax=Frigoriglobus tundricola TaxID=2774151 RepID=A0A6M5YZH6_9BACT|nr:hypothetical protein FTUN_6963 [Frigoriglobus tundricola]